MRKIVLGCALLLFSLQASADTITVGVVTGGNAFPFGGAATSQPYPGTRYQQAYDASSFTALGPISITGISFFRSGTSGTLAASTYDLYLSTITAGINTLSNTLFNDNLGPDNALFVSAGLAGPMPATLSFTGGPFLFDPAAGNLLLDVIVTPGGVPGYTGFYQATGESSTAYSRYHNFGGGFQGMGLVTQFEYTTAIPEPGPMALLGGGLLALGLFARRLRRP